MVLLSESDIEALLNAVPSFEEPYRKAVAERADYEHRFPKKARSPEERSREFLWELAVHLGARVALGELHEVEWLGAALEDILARVPEDAAIELTVGFLESFVHIIEHAGADASVVTPLMRGPRVRWRWEQAYGYTRGVYLYDRSSGS